jgi:hypothetical protein
MAGNRDRFITAARGPKARWRVGAPATACVLAGSLWAAAGLVYAQTAGVPSPGQPAQQVQAAPGAAPIPSPATPPNPAPPGPAGGQGRGLFPSQPAPAERPGFIYAFGRWWDSTTGKLEDLTKQPNNVASGATAATQDVLKNAAEATKRAATELFRLPGTRVFEINQRCEVAPNGAPDCGSAAANACRRKGFSDGRPIDVRTAANCPPAVWMSGREPAPGECPEETVVLMTACQ